MPVFANGSIIYNKIQSDVARQMFQSDGITPITLGANTVEENLIVLGRIGSITATTISFANSDNSINDSGNGFLTAGFKAGQRIKTSGTTNNNLDDLLIVSVLAGKIVVSGGTITTESAGASVSIISSDYIVDQKKNNVGTDFVDALSFLGSSIKGETLSGNILQANSNTALASQDVRFVTMYLPQDQVITGIAFSQRVQGSYTASNFNGVGLFSYGTTTLTRIALSANTPTFLTALAGAFVKVPFTAPIFLRRGIYFGAIMFSASVTVTPPQIGFLPSLATGGANALDLGGSFLVTSRITGATAIPTSQTFAGLAGLTSIPYLSLYT